MEIEIIFKIAVVGIIIAILNVILSKVGREEYVMLTTIAGIIAVAFMLIDYIRQLIATLEKLFSL